MTDLESCRMMYADMEQRWVKSLAKLDAMTEDRDLWRQAVEEGDEASWSKLVIQLKESQREIKRLRERLDVELRKQEVVYWTTLNYS